jgi:hypothetical protein
VSIFGDVIEQIYKNLSNKEGLNSNNPAGFFVQAASKAIIFEIKKGGGLSSPFG